MRTIDAIRRSGVGISPERSIHDAAVLMDQAGVGSLAVMDGDQLVGIVTDRDLVRRGLAHRVPSEARVDSVMSMPVVTISADADVHDAFALFRTHAVRRLVVMQGTTFAGTLSIDDLLIDLASELADLVRPVTAEVIFGHHDPSVPTPA